MRSEIDKSIKIILNELGYPLDDENFVGTPARVRKFLQTFVPDPGLTPADVLSPAFKAEYTGIVMQKNIQFVSLCAHHMLPFRGTAAVAYIPQSDGRVVGLSKLARIVHFHARRLTLQEVVTRDIAESLEDVLMPKGVMVVLEGSHDCMMIRGIAEPNALTITSSVSGAFLDNVKGSKDEFLQFLKGSK